MAAKAWRLLCLPCLLASVHGSSWNKAVEMFRVHRQDGTIEFIDNDIYSGPDATSPLHVIALFGTTSGGKSTTCRFLSCSMGVPTSFPSSTIGPSHEPTRGLWGSHFVDVDGKRYIILDIEGFDNSEQDQKVAEAILKLLALLSEVTSVFVQLRATRTIQASDLEYIATFVSQVRNTLLKRPSATTGDAGPDDNFPALLIGHVMPVRLSEQERQAKAFEITEQALGAQPEVIQAISENYVELSRSQDVGVHFDYVPVYQLPMFKKLQEYIDTSPTPEKMREQVQKLVDMNEDESSPIYHAGQVFLDDIDFLRDTILKASRGRSDGRGEAITPQSFRELLKWGVQEMNKVGPLSGDYLWEKIAIDSCAKQLQEKIGELEERVKSVAAGGDGLSEALRSANQDLEEFFAALNLPASGRPREECEEVKANSWALVEGPFKLLEEKKRRHQAEEKWRKEEEKLRQQADEAEERFRQEVEEAKRRTFEEQRLRWTDYLQHNLPWVALILLSIAVIFHRLSTAVAGCCECFSFKRGDTARQVQDVEMTRMRQLEFDLVEARAQLQTRAGATP